MSESANRDRRFLYVGDDPNMNASHARPIRSVPPDEPEVPDTSSFSLLGTVCTLEPCHGEEDTGLQMPGVSSGGSLYETLHSLFLNDLDGCDDWEGSLQGWAGDPFAPYKDRFMEGKLAEAVQAVGLVLGGRPRTVEQAMTLLGMDTMRLLLVGANVFTLIEQSWIDPSYSASLWRHSLRTATIAGRIATYEHLDEQTVLHACVAGIFHDLGLLALATLEPERYEQVIVRAQKQNRSLASVEEEVFGVAHHTVGASLLERMHLPAPIIEAVAFHDEPSRSLEPGCSAVTAVYAANILDGGGWAHDSDGVPTPGPMEYLAARGLAGRWPHWRDYAMRIEEREFWDD